MVNSPREMVVLSKSHGFSDQNFEMLKNGWYRGIREGEKEISGRLRIYVDALLTHAGVTQMENSTFIPRRGKQ